MFFPYRDDNPHTITPVVTYALIAVCVVVFLWQVSLSPNAATAAIYVFGLVPGDLFGLVEINPALGRLPGWMTIFTSMFLHGGWMHLIGNMAYLWIFGDNIEASLGHVRYFVFYLVCGVAAAVAQIAAAPGSEVPMIGASGAISGVLGAYLVLHPRANIRVFVWFILIITRINLPAWVVLGIWFVGQLVSSAGADPGAPGVAFMAHIGGFVAGAVLVFFFKKPSVPVLSPAQSRAFEIDSRRVHLRGRGQIPNSDWSRRRGPWD
jgi:membrane associated rhomboid family serine protease